MCAGKSQVDGVPASGPSSATGGPSVAFIFFPASPFTPGSADPAGLPATGGQGARTTVWERPPRIHQVSCAAAPPGGCLRNDLRKNLALFSTEQRAPQGRTAGAELPAVKNNDRLQKLEY